MIRLMTSPGPVTPRKVLRRATQLGVHADCIAANDGACEPCVLIFNEVFHEMYGHAKDAGEALQLIIDDILQDSETNE